MTIQFHIRGMNDATGLRRQVEADSKTPNRLLAVTSAQVGLPHEREVTPAYQSVAMLAVSGPDIHAAARDHTWPAAWQTVVARRREQIEQRRSRQTTRPKGPPQIHGPAGRRAKRQRPRGRRVHDHEEQGTGPSAPPQNNRTERQLR